MELHSFSPNPGSKPRVKRLGCGERSGHGKTAWKGNKGQKARSGSGTRVGFEGGQMPLHRRLPKRGFNNHDFRDKVGVFNVGELDDLFHLASDRILTIDGVHHVETSIVVRTIKYDARIARITAAQTEIETHEVETAED